MIRVIRVIRGLLSESVSLSKLLTWYGWLEFRRAVDSENRYLLGYDEDNNKVWRPGNFRPLTHHGPGGIMSGNIRQGVSGPGKGRVR